MFFYDISKEDVKNMSLEELYKIMDEQRVKAGLPPCNSTSQDSEHPSKEELPPETHLSTTPIGNGFVNVINLDEIDQPAIRRSLSPPLQEPRKHYSSDSDDDIEFITKRLPPRPPSRVAEDVITKRFNLDRPKSPITIAPTFNKPEFRKEPFQEGIRAGKHLSDEENKKRIEQMQQQLQNLQNENTNLRANLTIARNTVLHCQRKVQTLQIANTNSQGQNQA